MNLSMLRERRWEVCYSRGWDAVMWWLKMGTLSHAKTPQAVLGTLPHGAVHGAAPTAEHMHPGERCKGARHPTEQRRPPHPCFSILPPTPGTKRCRAPL